MKDRYYITTAIDYTNGAPHIGHAYEKVLADVIARFRRLRGERVFFLTGVDQHGQKVQLAAEKAGMTAREFSASITEKFKALWELLDVRPDGWAETTDPRHARAVQRILQEAHDRGDLYKARHEGFYSVRQEQFLTEKERGPDGEFGPEWGEVVKLEEENWYFKLMPHREWLLGFIRSHADFVVPSFRRIELLNAVEKLSGDLCISRPKERLAWGIELPFDQDYVAYVWFDALINYVSFAGYRAESDASLPAFDALWPCDHHVIGKDILVPPHGVYWPIMLHAMGFSDAEIPKLLVHGWWNMDGAKMSKSLGNSVDPMEICARYGPETFRYFLMRDIATGQDADFSEERLKQRHNADLANDLGNLLNRTLNMAGRYRSGVVRAGAYSDDAIAALRALASETVRLYDERMFAAQIHSALEAVWALVGHCNGFIETAAPWKLAKDETQGARLDAVLYALADSLRVVATLIAPVLPSSARAMAGQLGLDEGALSGPLSGLIANSLPDGHVLGPPSPLFPRLE